MMSDRALYLFVGLVVGFVLGALTNAWHNKRTGHALSVKNPDSPERRSFKFKLGQALPDSIAMFFVVALTVYAALQSQFTNNKLSDQQETNVKQLACTVTYLDDTIDALNSRTTYSVEQNKANADLQNAQDKFLSSINPDSPTIPSDIAAALKEYRVALANFQTILAKSRAQITFNNYPTNEQLQNCLKS